MDAELRDRLVAIEALQGERKGTSEKNHKENKETIGTLFSKIDTLTQKISSLPCEVHSEKIKTNRRLAIGVYVVIGMSIGGVIARMVIALNGGG